VINYRFINKIANLPFIDEIWIFGSRARLDHSERSDIDLAIICPTATNQDWHKVLELIDNSDTLLKIDCVRFDQLSTTDPLKNNILKFKKILYNRENNYMDKALWKDYFDNLGNALTRLNDVLNHTDLNNIDYLQDAAIQRFEFVIELYWKVLKKFLNYEKIDSSTPRDVLRKSFQFNLIDNEDMWLRMLDDRNNTSHVYSQKDAEKIFENIKIYYPIMDATYKQLKTKYTAS